MKIKYLVLICLFFSSTQIMAKDLKVKNADVFGNYLFLESAQQKDLLTIVGKTETVVTSRSENITTSGLPIRSWVVSTRWIDDAEGFRSALAQALASHPEWQDFAKDREDVTSHHCSFRLKDADIKVTQGDRTAPLTSSSILCTYVVHTKNHGDEKLLAAIAQNALIDSGISSLKVTFPGAPQPLIDAQNLSDALKNLGLNSQQTYRERDAATYLGLAFMKVMQDWDDDEAQDVVSPERRSELLSAMNQAFDRVYSAVVPGSREYRFQPISASSPVNVPRLKSIVFNPQSEESR